MDATHLLRMAKSQAIQGLFSLSSISLSLSITDILLSDATSVPHLRFPNYVRGPDFRRRPHSNGSDVRRQNPSTSCPQPNPLTEPSFYSRIKSRLFGKAIGESHRKSIRLPFGGKSRSPGRVVTGNHYEPGTLTHCSGRLHECPRGCLDGAARSIPFRNSSAGGTFLNRRRIIPVNCGVEEPCNFVE